MAAVFRYGSAAVRWRFSIPLWYESDSAEPVLFGSPLSLYMLFFVVLCGRSAHIEFLIVSLYI